MLSEERDDVEPFCCTVYDYEIMVVDFGILTDTNWSRFCRIIVANFSGQLSHMRV